MKQIVTPFLVLENFLQPEDREALAHFVRESDRFEPARVTKPGKHDGEADTTSRRAEVAEAAGDIIDRLEADLRSALPHARRELGVSYFPPGAVERQVTAHGDGDFFGFHNDIGDPWSTMSSRRVSFVYYFHEEPRGFSGGQLRLYDTNCFDDGRREAADSYRDIEPTDNSVIFFASDAYHEVLPVHLDGDRDPHDARRFTVNGWFHDPEHVRAELPLEPEMRTALAQRYTPSFTDIGFVKIETPPAIHRELRAVYDQRLANSHPEMSDQVYLPDGDPDFLPIDDVKGAFHLALQPIHEEWSGQELVRTAAYGLRVYRSGQTLLPHTDTLASHVISSIVHIAHDTTEPWPLWIVDLAGNEHHVFLEEGEMLLYESARCPHARPLPLQGNAYCSLFLHYMPTGWDVTYWSLLEQARADGATDLLPPELWPVHSSEQQG